MTKINVYQTDDGGYVVSSGGAWVPGVYDTEQAARESAELYDSDIDEWVRTIGLLSQAE